jgi:hypothetical protein
MAVPAFLKINVETDVKMERKLSEGGMGEIWLARPASEHLKQCSNDRPLIIKLIKRKLNIRLYYSFIDDRHQLSK